MPTDAALPDSRYIATGHFHERPGYNVFREAGSHDWLLIYTVDGHGRFTHRGGSFTTAAHDVVLIAPGVYHGYEVDRDADRWELLWAHFVPPQGWLAWMDWPAVVQGLMRLSIGEEASRGLIIGRLTEAHRIKTSYVRRREPLAMNALEACLLWCDEQNPNSARQQLDHRIRDALDYLCQNFDEPITMPQLGEHVGLSPSRLRHLFREQVGTSPQQFLEQQRITRAKQLLELSGYTISEVAEQVGFECPFYFTLRFKRATGMSPTRYRETYAQRAS